MTWCLTLKTKSRPISILSSTLRQLHKSNEEDNFDSIFYNMPPKKIKKYLEEEKKFNGKLVYVGQLTTQLFRAKTLSLSSSVLGIALLPFLNTTLTNSSIFSQAFVYGTTGFFIFVTPIFAQYLTRRYVSRIYYNYEEKKFTAVMLSFFMTEYKIEFGLEEICVPDLPGVFATCMLKSTNRSLFIDLNTVIDADLVQKIYGYDKPFDIKKYTDGGDNNDKTPAKKN